MITIKNFAFTVSGTAQPGARIMVMNEDNTAHSVTADSAHSFTVVVQPGKSAILTAPRTAGRYPFHCEFHSDMHATLVVRAK